MSSIILLVKNEQPGGTCELGGEHHVDTVAGKSEQRPKCQAVVLSREKTGKVIKANEV